MPVRPKGKLKEFLKEFLIFDVVSSPMFYIVVLLLRPVNQKISEILAFIRMAIPLSLRTKEGNHEKRSVIASQT